MCLGEAEVALRGDIDKLTAGNLRVQCTKTQEYGDVSGRTATDLLNLIWAIGGCFSTQPEELAGGVHGKEVNWRSRAQGHNAIGAVGEVIGATLVVEAAELVVVLGAVVVHGGGGGGGDTQAVSGRGAATTAKANNGKAAITDWLKCMMTMK